MTDKKGWFKQLVYSVKYTYFSSQILHHLLEGDEMGLIEYLGLERTIVLVSPDNLDELKCKFLTIPA